VLFSENFAQSQVSLSDSSLIFILDNSGSMAEVLKGDKDIKLNVAKEAINKALENSELDSLNMGLLEIGGHCEVKQLVSPNINNRQAMLTANNNVHPRPYLDAATPIAESIYKASKILEKYRGEKRIILVSDGEANCQDDNEFPLSACDMVASLKNQGINFSLNLIGYGDSNNKDFECIANLSDNYTYTSTDNPESVKKAVAKKTNFWQESKTLIDQIREFVTSVEGLITAVMGILAIFLRINKQPPGGSDTIIERW
jgi:hypothetical protein